MTDDRVAPELRGKVPRFPAALDRAPNRLLAQALLSIMPSARVDGVVVEKVRIGGQGARLHRPDVARSRAALLWIHGGACCPVTPARTPTCATLLAGGQWRHARP